MTMPWHPPRRSAGGPGDFGDVDGACGIDADAVRGVEVAGVARVLAAAPACEQFAVAIEYANAAAGFAGFRIARSRPASGAVAEFSDISVARLVEAQVRRPSEVGPGVEVSTILSKALDSAILAIAYMDHASIVNGDAVRHMELTGTVAGFAPRMQQRAVRAKAMHAGVAIAVGYEYVAGLGDGDIRRIMKRRSAVANRAVVDARRASIRRHARCAECALQPAFRVEEINSMANVIGADYVIARIERDAMRTSKLPAAPGAEQLPIGRKDLHWPRSTQEDVDTIARIAGDGNGFAIETVRGERRPGFVGTKLHVSGCVRHSLNSWDEPLERAIFVGFAPLNVFILILFIKDGRFTVTSAKGDLKG